MFRRSRNMYTQPYYVYTPQTSEFVYSPQSGLNMPTTNPNEERFGGLLLPALGGFLVGSLVPSPWTPRPMYPQPVPYQNMYSSYGYQGMVPYPNINPTNPQ